MRSHWMIAFVLCCMLMPLLFAQTDTITTVDSVDFKESQCRSVAWTDADGSRREIHINLWGGYISRFFYDSLDCQDLYNHGTSGLNNIISHCTGKYYSSRQGHSTRRTYTVLFTGKYHAIERFSFFWPHYVRKADMEFPDKIKVTCDYLVTTGQDHLLIAYTFDTGRLPDLTHSLDAYDSRSPYNDIDWNGNRFPDVHHYACHVQNGTDCTFKLNVVDTTWTKTFGDNMVTYNMLWNYKSDREMGIVATENYIDKPMGNEWLDDSLRVRMDSTDTLRPGGHPFQNHALGKYRGEKVTWGTQWCIGRDSLAAGDMTLDGYPYYNYSVMVLLDTHANEPTLSLVAEQERYNNSSISAISGGTVASAGPGGPGDLTDVTWNLAGYNPVYRSWEVQADSDEVAITFDADTLKNPTFIVRDYNSVREPDTVTVSSIKSGAVLANGTDYYASVDGVGGRLFITFDHTFTGSSDIRITSPQEKTRKVTIGPDGGIYLSQVQVTLECQEAGAAIYYTRDGSLPDSTDTAYTDTLLIAEACTLNAVAYAPGKEPSGVASAYFGIVLDSIVPMVDTIIAFADPNKVVVFFTEEIRAAEAGLAANYTIFDGVTVESVAIDYDLPNKMTLTTTAMDSGKTYILITQNLKDPGGNAVALSPANTFQYLAHPTPDIARGLTGLWNFNAGVDTTAFDWSWHGNHGTIHGATWTDGKFGKALLFDGDSDYVEIDTAKYGILETNEFSVSLWARVDTAETVGVLIRRTSAPYPFSIEYSDTGYLKTLVRTYTRSSLTSNDTLEMDQWYHIVLTYKSGARTLYINNQPDSVDNLEGTLNVSNVKNTVIGDKFMGAIDNIRIYNRCLLAEEVDMLYNQLSDTVAIIPTDKPDLDHFGITIAPNPFSRAARLTFTLGHIADLKALSVHDLSGRCVHEFDITSPQVSWDGRGSGGRAVPGGVYLVRIQVGDNLITRRILLAR